MADLTQFDLGSARRIAGVVRKVEQEPPRARPLTFDPIQQQRRQKTAFRIATFAGAWGIGQSKVVTFKNQTSTPNTVAAINLFWPIPNDLQVARDCSIASEGTSWHLLVPQLYTASAATAAEVTNSALVFKTAPVVALAASGSVTFSVSAVTCTS
jgi:hypothetical protein